MLWAVLDSHFKNFCLIKTRRALVLLDFNALPIIYYCKNTSPQKKIKATGFVEEPGDGCKLLCRLYSLQPNDQGQA
jgi:hypothetical protein